ncbi:MULTISPECIES: cell wall metabolism sensor histidine kinase WalK [Actinosynnema]|uniref:sensor histidine kinase n=1 Tax=Actinosynnema TaxID=40566 RepID=UPI0020A32BC2|nr:HAMP domain-containing sensor histidine kinase [Actinosynnema pretiosum]MCP2096470.1 Signal transduction histidine kinase [Actinosynnema pretiosum]
MADSDTPTLTLDTTLATRPAPRRKRAVPARVRIMGWLLLLVAVVSLSTTLVTRNLLLREVDRDVRSALEQEAAELDQVLAEGVDRATGQPFADVRHALSAHLRRQYMDDDEVIVAWTPQSGPMLQDRAEPFRLGAHPEVLDPILASPDHSGTAVTPAGELRWIRVDATGTAGDRGALVVGYLVDRDRAEVASTVRVLLGVGLLGVVLAGASAWFVAGQILSPVRLVRRAAAEITEHDLTRRITVEGRDDVAALAEQFNAMLDRLERAFATQRRFLDDAGHELRTPITIVSGHLELLGDDPVERAEAVRLCLDELDRMNRMVNDLLLLAKAEQPDFIDARPVEVAELTGDVYAKVRAIGDRRWRLESIGEGVALLDEQRVTQAVVQLAQNAVQHSPEGSEVLIGSLVRPAPGGGSVSFWVADRGPGVRPEDAAAIFERFSRGSTGGAPGHRAGAGLGLAIVRAIAEAHGGFVRLTSAPGAGARFAVEVPLRVPEGGGTTVRLPVGGTRGGGSWRES